MIKVGGDDIMHAAWLARRLSGKAVIVAAGYIGDRMCCPCLLTWLKYDTDDEAHELFLSVARTGVIGSPPGVVFMAIEQTGARRLFRTLLAPGFDAAWELARVARIRRSQSERIGNIPVQPGRRRGSSGYGGPKSDAEPGDGAVAGRLGRLGGSISRWKQLVAQELSLDSVLASGSAALEQVQQLAGRMLVVNRMPIVEQGRKPARC